MSGASYSDAERSTLDRFASAMASAGAPTAQVSGGHVTNDGTGEAPAAWGGGGGGSGQIFNASVSSAGGGGTGGLGSGGTGTGSGGALSGNYDTDRRNARLADMDQGIADKQKRVDEINGKIGDLTKDRDAKQADLDKLLALPAPQQKLQADDIQKARDKLAAAEKSLADTTGSLADAQGNVSKAQRDKALELEKPAAKGAEAGAGDSGAAQQLGQGLIKGMFQELGFPDVFGKPFTEWGIWKLAMGGMGYGMGLLQNMGGGTGTGTGTGTGSGGAAAGSGGGAAAGSGGGAGDFLSSLFGIKIPGLDTTDTTHAGTGAPPGPADIPNAMAPSEGPANVPVGAQGQGPGAPGVQIHVNNNGVTTPDQFKSSVNNAQVDGSRQTATVGAAPVPGNP
jgi:hypothetical protein